MAKDHEVRAGDCINSLAAENGLFWEELWNHPKNAELKNKRKDPNVLKPGDLVHIPDIQPRIVTKPTEQRHKFVRKGVPAKFRIRLLEPQLDQSPPGQQKPGPASGSRRVETEDPETSGSEKEVPRKKVPYILEIDGKLTRGQSDDQGYIEYAIPPDAQKGTLTIDSGTPKETVIPLELGSLDPIDEISGVKHRLANLGFNCGDFTDEAGEDFAAALRTFQQLNGLPVTGNVDDATKSKLKELHGS